MVVVLACGNIISGSGMRPRDILMTSNGKTIQVKAKAGRKMMRYVKVLLRASVDISKGMFGLEGKTKGSDNGCADWPPLPPVPWYVLSFSLGYGPVPALLLPEIFARHPFCSNMGVWLLLKQYPNTPITAERVFGCC
ncbi:hypothetical protein Tco_0260209 [Tanacetum coccineum]